MTGNYTQDTLDFYLDYVDHELQISYEKLAELKSSRNAEYWIDVLQGIANEYTISSRYALMRFLYCIATGVELGSGDESTVFSVQGLNKKYQFEDLSLGHAASLTRKEINQYQSVLEERAQQKNSDMNFNKQLIKKAFAIQNKGKTLLTREEAMQLGHILGFNVQQMQWFLLRVFENGAGIEINSSSDLIDVYGFVSNQNVVQVEKLKREYQERCATICKEEVLDIRNQNWTISLESTIIEKIEQWNLESSDEMFMEWMLQQSPWLDQMSRTTYQVYCNLFAYAYRVLNEDIHFSDPYELEDTIKKICIRQADQEYTNNLLHQYNDQEHQEMVWKKIIKELIIDNDWTGFDDHYKAFRVISAEAGKLNLQHARIFHYEDVIEIGKDGKQKIKKTYTGSTIRLLDILKKETSIKKWDFLYLLWYIFNRACFANREATNNLRFNALLTFVDCANMILNKAGLEAFYPPHIMEQSMLISIIVDDDFYPGFIYDELCEAIRIGE